MTIPRLYGPYGASALQFAHTFHDSGVNAAWFHGFDAAAFGQCAQHGIAACVEFKTFRADFDKHPELVPTGINGKPIRYGDLVQGVCLSQTAFLEETEENLLRGLAQFNPAGIWFDYLTYAGWFETPAPDLQESCFCRECVTDFCESTGIDAVSPAEILSHHQHAWTDHKTDRIAGFAKHYSSLIKQHHPGTVVGAYMCPWTPEEFDEALTRIFAQDYNKLSPYIDIFTPLIYVKKSGKTTAWGREYLSQAQNFIPSGNKVALILDANDGAESLLQTAEAVNPSWGFQVFAGEKVFGDSSFARQFHQAVLRNETHLESV